MQEGGKRMTAEENKERMRSWNESSTQEEGNNDNRIERRKKEKDRRKQDGKYIWKKHHWNIRIEHGGKHNTVWERTTTSLWTW
jgi:hypothetical protein